MGHDVWIGCAGWTLPRESVAGFPGSGTHLERYARVFPAVEINTTFYRPHRPETFERWAASVPAGFRFSLKTHRAVTHFRRLKNTEELLTPFFEASARLGRRRGPVVVQLPPTLRYDAEVARDFFRTLRRLYRGPAACEPRHPSWFEPSVEPLLVRFEVARVAADPPRARVDARPGGSSARAELGHPSIVRSTGAGRLSPTRFISSPPARPRRIGFVTSPRAIPPGSRLNGWS